MTVTATVTPAAASGTVQFMDGVTLLSTMPLSGGTAAIATGNIAVGTHSITVVYSGDTTYAGSTSVPATLTVTKATSGITLTASANPSTTGDSLTFTAVTTPSIATGTVQFLDGATVLGTSPLNSSTATLATSTLSIGSHSITAVYSGDTNYAGSTSAVLTQAVSKAPTTTSLSVSTASIAYGQSVDVTASVTPAAATGTVQFLDGASPILTLPLNGGPLAFTAANLTAGTHSITAVYSGDATFATSTSALATVTVAKATPPVAVASSANPSVNDASIILTATVAAPIATGTVQFLDGATVLGTATLAGNTGDIVVPLTAGTHSITAVYSGDGNLNSATSPVFTQTVNKSPSSLTLASSLNPSTVGQPVTFSAAISPVSATATVQFLDGSTALGSATITSGVATISVSTLTGGSHSITAVYSGDAYRTGSTSTALAQTVSKIFTTAAVSLSASTIVYGHDLPITATVAPAAATGTVQFLDGGVLLTTLSLSGGTAATTFTNMPAGTHSITVVYSGDASYAASTSAAAVLTVTKAASGVTLVSSLNPSVAGQAVTFTAAATPPSATGTVQFLDGATVIGTAPLIGGSAPLATAALATGTHAITAIYSGDANFSGATSVAVAQLVKAVTATTLSASASTAIAGQPITFTAAVAPASAAGSVQFLDGATVIGTVTLSGGSAALTVSSLGLGSHSITATYAGAAGYAPSASAVAGVAIVPASPSRLIATALSSSQIRLNWTASATSGATYNVYASPTAGFTPAPANRIAAGVAATTFTHTGLAPNTTMYYTVTAQAASIESVPANQATATTPSTCKVTYQVTSQWNGGFGTSIAIKNIGAAPVHGWQLTWTWPGSQHISEAWNATDSQTGANATLTNEAWNANINPGTTLNGIGFNGTFTGTNPAPAAFYLNGTLCQ